LKLDKNILNNRWASYALAGCITVIVYLLLSNIGGIFGGLKKIGNLIYPVFMGFCFAYVMDPLVNVFDRSVFDRIQSPKIRRSMSILLTVFTVLLVLTIFITALVPQIAESVVTLVSNFGIYAETLQSWLNELNESADLHNIDISALVNSSGDLLNKLTSTISNNLNNIVNTSFNIGKYMATMFIAFIMAIYFLGDKVNLREGFKNLMQVVFPPKTYAKGAVLWKRCNDILVRYIAFDVLDGLIVGIANGLFMVLTGMPYIMLISVVVGVTNLAPTFGPIVGGAIGCFILMLIKPTYALWFLLFTLVLQTIDGYVLKPKLFGGQLGVSSVWILVSLIIGGRMFGVAGILLAIPFAAISDFLYRENFMPWLKRVRWGKEK